VIPILVLIPQIDGKMPNQNDSTGALLSSPPLSSLLVCTLMDGSIITLYAKTGKVSSFFSTGRDLVTADASSSKRIVVPDRHGNLYWHKTMQVLPTTIAEILKSPLQTCLTDYDTINVGDDCGIVTGTKLTLLYGLDASTGSLLWTSHTSSTPRNSSKVVVLQREDVFVQQISTATGFQLWNLSVGEFSALDFSPNQGSNGNTYLVGGKGEVKGIEGFVDDDANTDNHQPMPFILFDEKGRVLTVLDPQEHRILWRKQFPTMISGVYGLREGNWITLKVFEEPPNTLAEEDNSEIVPLLLPSMPETNMINIELFIREKLLKMMWQDKSMALYEDFMPYKPPLLPDDPFKGKQQEGGIFSNFETNTISIPSGQQKIVIEPNLSSDSELAPGGLFLTWPILASLVMLLICVLFLLAWFYNKKKEKWLATPSLTPNQSTEQISFLELAPSSNLTDQNLSSKDSVGHYRSMSRSLSMPLIPGEKSNELTQEDKMLSKMTHLVNSQMPENAQQLFTLADMPNKLNGIPLVRYSRYRSEFKEVSTLGKGGFGSVFVCENGLDGRKYAIKKVIIQTYDDPMLTNDQLERVLREVKILASLDHPNIVRYYTAWLEVEEANGKGSEANESFDDEYHFMNSKFMSKCYSSSLLLENKEERPSENGKAFSFTKKKAESPLGGWNDFLSEFSQPSFTKKESMESLEEYGFHFERSEGEELTNGENYSKSIKFQPLNEAGSSLEEEDSWSDSYSIEKKPTVASKKITREIHPAELNVRHILYIQMQLCSQQTLADFLADREARKGDSGTDGDVDILYALKLFHQVAQGVRYVHSRDLIHRDLKPNNCFLDDSGIMKVGDFGLSREANNDVGVSHKKSDSYFSEEGGDNTAGVGTRSYASPEQIEGSDYDASTDIFSLGFILFELCYSMFTGMERYIVFSNLRQSQFPESWTNGVAKTFPTVHSLLVNMISINPHQRPSACHVAQEMENILGEFTLLSIDKNFSDRSLLLLRVEATSSDGILAKTMNLIKDCAPGVKIEKYGLRGGENKAIIEFALSNTGASELDKILEGMNSCSDIKLVSRTCSGRERKPSIHD